MLIKKIVIEKKKLNNTSPQMYCLIAKDESGNFVSSGGYSGNLTDISININLPVKYLTLKGDGTIELGIGEIKIKIA